jgi:hypothetical protein
MPRVRVPRASAGTRCLGHGARAGSRRRSRDLSVTVGHRWRVRTGAHIERRWRTTRRCRRCSTGRGSLRPRPDAWRAKEGRMQDLIGCSGELSKPGADLGAQLLLLDRPALETDVLLSPRRDHQPIRPRSADFSGLPAGPRAAPAWAAGWSPRSGSPSRRRRARHCPMAGICRNA